MDCLGKLFEAAEDNQILENIGNQTLHFRASLYTDDVMIFIKPEMTDLQATFAILQLFADATGLNSNLSKSSILTICCRWEDLSFSTNEVACPFAQFPCTYVGLPLSDKRLRRVDFQRIVDKFMKCFACWKAKWITFADRLVLVTTVLSAIN